MPRGLTALQKAALARRVRGAPYFVSLDLSPTVYVWNGRGDFTVLGHTWKGLGELGIIDGLENDRALRANQISMTLSGVPGMAITAGAIEEARSIRYQGRAVSIYLGIQGENGVLVDDPVAIWVGFADVMTFQLGRSITATLTCEHFDSLLRRSNGQRMTTESHNARLGSPSPRDLFFEPQDRLMGVPKALI